MTYADIDTGKIKESKLNLDRTGDDDSESAHLKTDTGVPYTSFWEKQQVDCTIFDLIYRVIE